MPKINVYLPDELAEAVKSAGIPVSAVCQRALEQAVRRIAAIREASLGGLDDADLADRLPNVTPRARAALRLGFERARTDGSVGVGTGHVLAGILAEGSNLALQVLRVEEIDSEQLARDLADRAAGEPGMPSAGQTQQFSGPAAAALELAVTEATAFGHNYIGCEHLLLGLVAEPEGIAGQLLRSRGAELRLTRRAVAAALAGYVHLRAQTGTPPEQAGTGTGTSTELAGMLADAIRRELQPVVARIERLEERAGGSSV